MKWNIEACIIFEAVVGSKLYGIATEESDSDFRGVAIPPFEIRNSLLQNFEQQDGWDGKYEDRVIYNLKKFLTLCKDANPAIIELLFAPEKCWVACHREWIDILDCTSYFISKKAKYTFTGYAHSQLQRIMTHRGWLLSPPKEEPTREKFGLPMNPRLTNEQISAVVSIPADLFVTEYRVEAEKEKHYREARRYWDMYMNWKTHRNPARAALEEKYGYDCYAEETEFLTEDGWKRYDEVGNEMLATLNPVTHEIEYQKFINRVKYKVNNECLWLFSNQYSTFLVTENHKLFVSRMHRSKKNKGSMKYDSKLSNWEFLKLHDLMGQRKSNHHIVHAPINNKNDYPVSDDYLILMGLYCSEGSLLKFKKRKVPYNRKSRWVSSIKGVSLSQLEKKDRIKPFLDSIKEFEVRSYKFFRKGRFEVTYNIYDQHLGEKLRVDCGEYCRNKRLPSWIKFLSKRQCDILLDTLIAGDGSHRRHSSLYFTSSKYLMNDVNILALHAGYVTKVWDYLDRYPTSTVYISKRSRYGSLIKSHFKKMVYTGNVVCFEVPNTVLVTRFNGEISFQGNTKHAMHLIRLMYEGEELLLTGRITFPRPERDELVAVRNGLYTYDQLMEKVEGYDERFEELYEKSTLPHSPDFVAINNLYLKLIED